MALGVVFPPGRRRYTAADLHLLFDASTVDGVSILREVYLLAHTVHMPVLRAAGVEAGVRWLVRSREQGGARRHSVPLDAFLSVALDLGRDAARDVVEHANEKLRRTV